jgi:hypothetical protein
MHVLRILRILKTLRLRTVQKSFGRKDLHGWLCKIFRFPIQLKFGSYKIAISTPLLRQKLAYLLFPAVRMLNCLVLGTSVKIPLQQFGGYEPE